MTRERMTPSFRFSPWQLAFNSTETLCVVFLHEVEATIEQFLADSIELSANLKSTS